MTGNGTSRGEEETRTVAVKMTRDEMGFVTSEQPNLSLRQVEFLLSYATHHDLTTAIEESGATTSLVSKWMNDPAFVDVYDKFLENKREGTKQIGQQLVPLLLLTLTQLLREGDNKTKLGAAKLIAQMQGLLITHQTVVDSSALETLRERLMAPRPIYKELPSGKA